MNKLQRYLYKRKMFQAFEKISKGCLFKDCTKHQALRTIRDFERINFIEFDPFDSTHVDILSGQGSVGGSIRSLDLAFKRLNK